MDVRLLLAALLVFVVGCTPGEPKVETARPIDDRMAAAEDLPPVAAARPEKSDPAAAALVNAVLMAHTKSQPSLVEKFRKVHVKRKGDWRLPDGGKSDATMEIYIGGENYRTTYALAANGNVPQTFAVTGKEGWRFQPQVSGTKIPLDSAALEQVLPEIYGDRMTVLFPLASEKLVAAVAKDGKAGGGETILRVWVGDEPPMLVHIDPTTNRVARLSYEMRENGQPVRRTLTIQDSVVVAGVLVPSRIDYGVGPVALTSWTKIEYEVPAVFEPSIFEKP
jgi:hypothetical protein